MWSLNKHTITTKMQKCSLGAQQQRQDEQNMKQHRNYNNEECDAQHDN